MWFTEQLQAFNSGRIGRITPNGTWNDYAIEKGLSQSSPWEITVGPDKQLWFADLGNNAIGSISTSGVVNEYPTPTKQTQPFSIARGPGSTIWLTELEGPGLARATLP